MASGRRCGSDALIGRAQPIRAALRHHTDRSRRKTAWVRVYAARTNFAVEMRLERTTSGSNDCKTDSITPFFPGAAAAGKETRRAKAVSESLEIKSSDRSPLYPCPSCLPLHLWLPIPLPFSSFLDTRQALSRARGLPRTATVVCIHLFFRHKCVMYKGRSLPLFGRGGQGLMYFECDCGCSFECRVRTGVCHIIPNMYSNERDDTVLTVLFSRVRMVVVRGRDAALDALPRHAPPLKLLFPRR